MEELSIAIRSMKVLQSRVSFSEDGENWEAATPILQLHDWLWRLTWHLGRAYGVAYRRSDPKDKYKPWLVTLYGSEDGRHFQEICPLQVPGYPNETTLRFLKSGQMVALVRRDGKKEADREAWIGLSPPPFTDWSWQTTGRYFGGPNFMMAPDGEWIAAGRLLCPSPYVQIEKTVLSKLEPLRPILLLPSGGDCSYPGMVFHQNRLWVSYYSSHEGKAAIYLAQIDLI